jgi:hypothetical protein
MTSKSFIQLLAFFADILPEARLEVARALGYEEWWEEHANRNIHQ